jgi:hypothetical protein
MYPGEWKEILFNNALSGNSQTNTPNFDDPMSPDYISASPAFNAYYAKKRAERYDREFMQQLEHEEKNRALSSKGSDKSDEYISGSPAFDEYFAKKKAEQIECEFSQSREQAQKAGVIQTIVKNFHTDWPYVVPAIILPLLASIYGLFLWIFS